MADTMESNAAFRPETVFEQRPKTVDSVMEKTTHALKTAAKAARHPISTAKHKAAKTMALQDTPYLSDEADKAFIHAHEELTRAETASSEDEDAEEILARLRSNVDELEETRASLKAAWTTSRFVQRAGVVRMRPYRLPDRRDPLYWTSDEKQQWRFRSELFAAHILRYAHQDYNTQYFSDVNEVPFDKDILVSHLERLIVASGPWQAWILRLRKLSRWEDPKESAKWFAIWVCIWISNRVISFVLLWIIYMVVRHRMTPASRESFRESYARAVDRSTNAFKFNELVSRHGEAKWLEPLIESCGPVLQLQIADTADHLEVMNNFYNWTNPPATTATIAFIVTAVVFGNVTSTDFVMRSITMLAIGYFFLCRPVASWHPKYRHMVTPFKWIFWDIPTQADWSFQYLQSRARPARQSYAAIDETALRSFSCTRSRSPGHLKISASTLTFVSAMGSKANQSWYLTDLEQLLKLDRPAARSVVKLRSPRSLQILFADGTLETFEGMSRRDEAFNTIIGLSKFMWKQLPSLPRDGKGDLDLEGDLAQAPDHTPYEQADDEEEGQPEEWYDAID